MHPEEIYLDTAASTPIDPRVLEVFIACARKHYAHPDSLHALGREVRAVLNTAYADIAEILHASSDEITCTSGGTEANALAILGTVEHARQQGIPYTEMHIVTTPIEHRSVLACVAQCAQNGVAVTYLTPESSGLVAPESLKRALRKNTVLVSVLYAHNEIGTIQPIQSLVRTVKSHARKLGYVRPVFHTDASQAPAWLTCDVTELGVDLMTLDAQKCYGPKGVGCLYHAKNANLAPLVHASNQLRPGTPPVPLIVAFAHALRLVAQERATYIPTITRIRDESLKSLSDTIPQMVQHGALPPARLANSMHIAFPGLDGEHLVLALSAQGVYVSTRSACLHDSAPGSYVLRALGAPEDSVLGALRLTLSRFTTQDEMKRATDILIETVLRMYREKR